MCSAVRPPVRAAAAAEAAPAAGRGEGEVGIMGTPVIFDIDLGSPCIPAACPLSLSRPSLLHLPSSPLSSTPQLQRISLYMSSMPPCPLSSSFSLPPSHQRTCSSSYVAHRCQRLVPAGARASILCPSLTTTLQWRKHTITRAKKNYPVLRETTAFVVRQACSEPDRQDSVTAGRFGLLSTGRALGWGAWGRASILSETETYTADWTEKEAERWKK